MTLALLTLLGFTLSSGCFRLSEPDIDRKGKGTTVGTTFGPPNVLRLVLEHQSPPNGTVTRVDFCINEYGVKRDGEIDFDTLTVLNPTNHTVDTRVESAGLDQIQVRFESANRLRFSTQMGCDEDPLTPSWKVVANGVTLDFQKRVTLVYAGPLEHSTYTQRTKLLSGPYFVALQTILASYGSSLSNRKAEAIAEIEVRFALLTGILEVSGFAITSRGSEPDLNPGDGLCYTGDPRNECTLTAVIEEINALQESREVFIPGGVYNVDLAPIQTGFDLMAPNYVTNPTTTINEKISFIGDFGVASWTSMRLTGGITLAGTGDVNFLRVRAEAATNPNFGAFLVTGARNTLNIQFSDILGNQSMTSGGAISVSGAGENTVNLRHSNVFGNHALGPDSMVGTQMSGGGAIFVSGSLNTVSVFDTYFLDNRAERNGQAVKAIQMGRFICDACSFELHQSGVMEAVIAAEAGGIITLTNTIVASSFGTAVKASGPSVVDISFSTIANNTNPMFGQPAGVAAEFPATLSISASILYNNNSYNMFGMPIPSNCSNILSAGNNLTNSPQSNCPSFVQAGDSVNLRPDQIGLLPLGSFGGRFPTFNLTPTSRAVDLVDIFLCLATDARIFPRPFAARCDSGAIEWMP